MTISKWLNLSKDSVICSVLSAEKKRINEETKKVDQLELEIARICYHANVNLWIKIQTIIVYLLNNCTSRGVQFALLEGGEAIIVYFVIYDKPQPLGWGHYGSSAFKKQDNFDIIFQRR